MMRTIYLAVLLFMFNTVLFSQVEKVATLKYDMIRQINSDQSRSFRSNSDGDGDASGPTTLSDERIIYFKDTLATYDRQGGRMRMFRQRANSDGSNQFKMPFEDKTFYDMKNRQEINYITVLKDEGNEYYHTIEPIELKGEWKDLDKSKKILGFNCKKASITTPKDTYTIWYTTEAGFDFSPMINLAPTSGLVLKLEGSDISFDATSFERKLDSTIDFKKPNEGKLVSKEELMQKRRAAFEKFRPGK
ncbi:MAG TPA: GLPGLI family protein [Saprospiraceae bacterium]|nr:GLPGLI family protein [Saprospiraceae bacterium]